MIYLIGGLILMSLSIIYFNKMESQAALTALQIILFLIGMMMFCMGIIGTIYGFGIFN